MERITSHPITALAAAFIVCVLGFYLRWQAAISLPIDWDEPVYYKAAYSYAQSFRDAQFGQILNMSYNYEHPALAKLIYAAVLTKLPLDQLLHDERLPFKANRSIWKTPDPFHILALRKVSVIFGGLEVLALSLFSPLAGLLLAVHSMTIKYTSVIYLESLPALMSTLAVILFQRGWKRDLIEQSFSLHNLRREKVFLTLSAASFGLACAAKYQYATIGLAIGVYAIISLSRNRTGRLAGLGMLLIWGLLSLASFILADPYLWPNPPVRLAQSVGYSLDYTQGHDVQQAAYPFYQPLIWLTKPVLKQPEQAVPSAGGRFLFQIDSWIALLAVIGLPRLAKKYPLMLTWLGIGLVFLLLWNTKWPQYILTVTTPLSVAAAEGIATLVNVVRPRKQIREVEPRGDVEESHP